MITAKESLLKHFINTYYIKPFSTLFYFCISCTYLCSFAICLIALQAEPLTSKMHTDTKPNLHKKQQLLLQKIPKDSWYILSIHHVSQNASIH